MVSLTVPRISPRAAGAGAVGTVVPPAGVPLGIHAWSWFEGLVGRDGGGVGLSAVTRGEGSEED